MGYTFEWHRRPYSDRSQIDFFAGAYVQYNFIPELGLQFNVNYQRGVYEWELDRIGLPYSSGKDRFDFFSLNLNGVYTFIRGEKIHTYILAGGGFCFGDWFYSFDGTYFNVNIGPGIKIYIGKSRNRVALNIGGSYNFLYEYIESCESNTASYILFFLGIEL